MADVAVVDCVRVPVTVALVPVAAWENANVDMLAPAVTVSNWVLVRATGSAALATVIPNKSVAAVSKGSIFIVPSYSMMVMSRSCAGVELISCDAVAFNLYKPQK
jgi:hypothetical protein